MGQRNAGGGAGQVALVGGAPMSPVVSAPLAGATPAPAAVAEPPSPGAAGCAHRSSSRSSSRPTTSRPACPRPCGRASLTCRAPVAEPDRRRRQRQCRRDRRGRARRGRRRRTKVDVVVIGCSRAGKGAAVRRGLLTSTLAARRLLRRGPRHAARDARRDRRGPPGRCATPSSRPATCPAPASWSPQPLRRRAGGDAFRLLTRKLVPGVADTQCGFKFFRRDDRPDRDRPRAHHRLRLRRRVARPGPAGRRRRSSSSPSPGPTPPVRPSTPSATACASFRAVFDLRGSASDPDREPRRPARAARAAPRIVVLNWRDVRHPQAGGAEQYMHQIAARWVEAGRARDLADGRGAGQSGARGRSTASRSCGRAAH